MHRFAMLAVLLSAAAGAHSGGLDRNGGHYNRKTGEYHCHRCPPPPTPVAKPQTEPPKRPKPGKPVKEL